MIPPIHTPNLNYSRSGNIPFDEALRQKEPKLLIANGIDVHSFYLGLSSLHFAVILNSPDTCEALIQKGVAVDVTDQGPLSAYLAQSLPEQNLQFFPQILSEGLGTTPLHLACALGYVEVVKILLKYGADPQKRQTHLINVFYEALRGGNDEIIEMIAKADGMVGDEFFACGDDLEFSKKAADTMLKHGWNLNQNYQNLLTKKRITPLIHAINMDQPEFVEFLVYRKADINFPTVKGITPLAESVLFRRERTINFLLGFGANIQTFGDKNFTTPYLYFLTIYPQDPLIDQLKKADNGFTRKVVDFRLFGHSFSLSDKPFGGLPQQQTYVALAGTILTFTKNNPKAVWMRSVAECLLNAIDPSVAPQNQAEQLEKGKVVMVRAGILNHAISIVFFKRKQEYWMSKGNRSYPPSVVPLNGIKFYTFDYQKAEFVKVIEQLHKLAASTVELDETSMTKEQKKALRAEQMRKIDEEVFLKLNLKQQDHYHLPSQKGNNCAYVAARLSVRAAFVFLYLGDTFTIGQVLLGTQAPYTQLMRFDRRTRFFEHIDAQNDPIFNTRLDFDKIHAEVAFAGTRREQESILEAILKRRPHLVNTQNPAKSSLLHYAAYCNSVQAVKILLRYNVDTTLQDNKGNTPLHLAAANNCIEICDLLLHHNMMLPQISNFKRERPIDFSREPGIKKMLKEADSRMGT